MHEITQQNGAGLTALTGMLSSTSPICIQAQSHTLASSSTEVITSIHSIHGIETINQNG